MHRHRPSDEATLIFDSERVIQHGRLCHCDPCIEARLNKKLDDLDWLRKKRRQANAIKHGPDCDCNDCLEHESGLDVDLEFLTIDGIPIDGEQDVSVDLLAKYHADAHYQNGGPLVHEWNLPHHGEGAPDCGEVHEWVGGILPSGTLTTWPRMKRCGQRDCQRCGPEVAKGGETRTDGTPAPKGSIIKPGVWELRSARRAAEAIEGHREDRRQGMHKRRLDGERIVEISKTVRMMKRGHERPPAIGHVVWSPHPDRWDNLPAKERTANRLANLYRECYRDLKSCNVIGGYAVTHGLRIPSKWNERPHAVEGFHIHCIVMTHRYDRVWLNKDRIKEISGLRGTVLKVIVDKRGTEKGDLDILNNNDGSEGGDPNRNVFGTLLYLLSHATWPTLAVLRVPGETFRHRRRDIEFPLFYPAFVKTSTQTKAIRPFGEWVHSPETVVVLPCEEDICPATGHQFAAEEVWPVLFDRPPPDDEPFRVVPVGAFEVDHERRVFRVPDPERSAAQRFRAFKEERRPDLTAPRTEGAAAPQIGLVPATEAKVTRLSREEVREACKKTVVAPPADYVDERRRLRAERDEIRAMRQDAGVDRRQPEGFDLDEYRERLERQRAEVWVEPE